jgi:polar amino acid transport system substrate-binding protein
LFHPPLIIARQRMGMGKIVVPTPVLQIPTSAALRKDADRSFVDWVDEMIGGYYRNGQTTSWYDSFLVGAGIDPKSVPGLIKQS